jgi:D-alanyl-lipoteichoic acid acyltransferase DltB (MBOAT superfamily)
LLFNSLAFLAFLPTVLLVFHLLRGTGPRNLFLLLASYVFYASWDPRFLALIILSTVVDFEAARRIEAAQDPGSRKRWLQLSLAVNLGILGFFKYWNFGIESLGLLLASLGLPADLPTLEVILPVGISFYTFQTMGYTLDVYRGTCAPARSLREFAVYVAYFPQLVAGPIERASHLLPQLQEHRPVSFDDVWIGSYRVALGFFLKVVLADTVAPLVNFLFANPDRVTGVASLMGMFGFSVQVYGDFCGYSLIARGVSRWMGIELRRNFEAPYLSRSVQEIWSRWHTSLTSWFSDYLFSYLTWSHGGRRHIARNLIITMVLTGVWHGAGWNFLLSRSPSGASRESSGPTSSGSQPAWPSAPRTLLTSCRSSRTWCGTFAGMLPAASTFASCSLRRSWPSRCRHSGAMTWTPGATRSRETSRGSAWSSSS